MWVPGDGGPGFLWKVGGEGVGQDAGFKAVRSQDSPLGSPPTLSCLSSRASPILPHRCPKEMGPHVPNVTSLCLQYMKHDPNYNYDSDGDEEQMETEDNEFSEQGGWPTCHWGGKVEMGAAFLGYHPPPAKDTSRTPILIFTLPQSPAFPSVIWVPQGPHPVHRSG